jgi:hypothetical protein
MKKYTLTAVAILVALSTQAQSKVFTKASSQKVHGREILRFTIGGDQNVRHYRIEASNDSASFETITIIASKVASIFPEDYDVDITAYDYKYFRVGKVEMGGKMRYSPIVSTEKPRRQPIPGDSQPAVTVH